MKSEISKRPQKTGRRKASDKTERVPKWLLDEADTLKAMIEWYKSREATAMEAEIRRPVFVGDRTNSGIRVNSVILERAVRKARQERFKTGGSLSQLVEWLLWLYIGSPADVVEGPAGSEGRTTSRG